MIYDWDTKNESALQLYQQLKDIGIQNNKMHLVLLDEGLKDIDIFDDNLPIEWVDRVIDEILNNAWFYYREVVRIPKEDGTLVPFRFDIGSYATIRLKFLGFDTYNEKPRQTGKTVEAMVTAGLSFNLLSENAGMQLFHFDDKKVKENLNEIKRYLSYLPKYLQIYTYMKEEKDGDIKIKAIPTTARGTSTFENRMMNNKIIAGTAGNNETTADKAGRGAKVKEVIGDEVGFWPYADVTLDAAIPAYNTASKNAKEGNKLSYFALMSTPPDVKTPHGKYLYNMIKIGALKFEPYMLDMSAEDIRRMMKKKGTGWIFISFQYYELGFPEEWAVEAFLKMGKMKFRRDYLLQWMVDFSESPFQTSDLEKLQDMARMKKYKAIRFMKDFDFKVYEYEDMGPEDVLRYFRNRPIVIGVDVATGLGGDRDSSTAVGTCPETGKTIFTFGNNTISTKEFADILMYFIEYFFRKGLLVIERNVEGVISNIRGTKYEKNMYYTPMSKDLIDRGQKAHIDNGRHKFRYGIWQIAAIRDTLYNDMLVDYVKNKKNLLDVEDIVNEICTLVYNNKNKIDHDKLCHDDFVMAKMLSIYPMIYDKAFTHRYNMKKVCLKNDIEEEFDYAEDEFEDVTIDEEYEDKVQTIDDLLYDVAAGNYDKVRESEPDVKEEDMASKLRAKQNKANINSIFNDWYDDNSKF